MQLSGGAALQIRPWTVVPLRRSTVPAQWWKTLGLSIGHSIIDKDQRVTKCTLVKNQKNESGFGWSMTHARAGGWICTIPRTS